MIRPRILYSRYVRTAGPLVTLIKIKRKEPPVREELIILDEDKAYATQRIAELQKEILDLGPEFYEVFNQSSETWHDNAPFDALRDRQSLLDAELQKLRQVLRDSLPGVPAKRKGQVGIGSTVELSTGKRYFIAGDWTPYAGQLKDGAMVISRKAPIAAAFLGKKAGTAVTTGKHQAVIAAIL
jgi:transcription elongation GreA/GreB family factor